MIAFSTDFYRKDFSKERNPIVLATFWHEVYHAFELRLGIVSWKSLAWAQISSGFSVDDEYDPTKSFLDNNPEARADAFAACVTSGQCDNIGDQRIPIDSTTFFKIGPGGITFYAIVTGSRIPRPIASFKPKNKIGLNDVKSTN